MAASIAAFFELPAFCRPQQSLLICLFDHLYFRTPVTGCSGRQKARAHNDNPLVDEAYNAKYRGSAYLSLMIDTRARAATVKVMPRQTDL